MCEVCVKDDCTVISLLVNYYDMYIVCVYYIYAYMHTCVYVCNQQRLDEIHGYAIVDNFREKLGNYNVEIPGIFRGRGNHPKTGRIKVFD